VLIRLGTVECYKKRFLATRSWRPSLRHNPPPTC